MKITQRLSAAVQTFRTSKNAMGEDIALGRQFLKNGNSRALVQDWSKVIIDDKEFYSGYPYAAIDRRANRVATLAKYNLKTDSTKEYQLAAKAKQEVVEHPYLDVIDRSKTFANRKFWYDISTYLDLEGVYYLFVLRAIGDNIVGDPQEFKLINPYNVRRIRNKDTLEIGGYVEARDGLIREIPPKMIIEIRKLNPFDDDDPFAMADAAKTAQFTMKQSGDYTRHSLKNNMAAPGIISTDVLLDPQQFTNFVSRVTNQEKGLPLFGNGAGAVTWDSMQIDMDKAGLKDINEINRQELMAVSGVGKTMLSIEESGTTRDTAKVQRDLFTEDHAMPQLELILDALNQDYKVNYESEYKKSYFELIVDNPLGTDREAELKDIEIRDESYKVYDKLVAQGYKRDLAAKFANGEIELDELGDPTEEPRPNPIIEAAMLKAGSDPQNPNLTAPQEDKNKDTKKKPKPDNKKKETHEHEKEDISIIRNEFDEESEGIINNQQGALQNAIMGIEARVVNSVINKVTKNAFEKESDVMSESERKDYERELEIAVAAFYAVMIPIFAKSILNRRAKEFGAFTNFKFNADIKKYIKATASKASESHISTILEDLRHATKEAYDKAVTRELDKLKIDGRKVTDADLKLARSKALEGASQQEIVNSITNEYQDISKNRAKAIARTETNRAFTQSQYQADIQFIKQNDLEGKAFKKWVTRSINPCPNCIELSKKPPIPFHQNFADLGDELVATYVEDGKTKVKKQLVNFEALEAGNAHVNCSCRYMLIIED